MKGYLIQSCSNGCVFMPKKMTHASSVVGLFICLVLLISAAGCHWPLQLGPAKVVSHPSPEALKAYHQAVEVYQNGDYAGAAKQFEQIREQTSNGTMARMALFGLACARLMIAETPEDYRSASDLWKIWVQSAPRNVEYENPLMFAPLIDEKMIFSNIPFASDPASAVDETKKVPQWILVKANEELQNLKERVRAGNLAAQQSQKKINALEKEITKLKRQIKAMETIDQKIQKKKNAIPSGN